MRRFTLCVLLFSFSIVACNRKKTDESSAKLASFKGFPPGVEGCSCYFSSTDKDFRTDNYIFVSDLDSTAWISVNGKQVRLKLINSTKPADIIEQDYQDTYSDGLYTLMITVHYKEHTGDEVWLNTGIMKLFFKEVEVDTRQFIGECGC